MTQTKQGKGGEVGQKSRHPQQTDECGAKMDDEQLYWKLVEQSWEDSNAMSDEFDKSVLTYSSLGLGLSLIFVKELVPLADAAWLWWLYASWCAFGLAILTTVASYQLSTVAQKQHREHLRKYYIEKDEKYLNKKTKTISWVGHIKWISGGFFSFAIVCILVFSIKNVCEVDSMTSRIRSEQISLPQGQKPSGGSSAEEKGRIPMEMPPRPQAPTPQANGPKVDGPSPQPDSSPKK